MTKMIAVCFLILLHVNDGFTFYQNVSIPLGTVELLPLKPNQTVLLTLKDLVDANDKFWSFEPHSFSSNDHLTLSKTEQLTGFVFLNILHFYSKLILSVRETSYILLHAILNIGNICTTCTMCTNMNCIFLRGCK